MSIAVSCPSCGNKRRVPDQDVCLGVRCVKCETFMEADRTTDLEALDSLLTGRRRVRQLTPLAKTWIMLMVLTSLMAAPLLYLAGELEAASDSRYILRQVIVTVTVGVLNAACAIPLLYLKKWGFWALVVVGVIGSGIGFAVGAWQMAIGEIIVVATLYGALRAGDPDSWSHLR
jgi:hypothetical protein